MRGILSGQRGLAPAVLVLVIAWALAAVLELTGTLLAANRIDDSVKIIKPEVSNIGTNSEAIALAARTARISGKIRVAAAPLTGELSDTLAAAKDIDTVAKSILVKAGAINATASSINGNVKLINGTVNSISGNADSINANVRSINRNALSINASVRSINGNTSAINTSVRGIDGNGRTILATTRQIDPRVAGINRRAVVIQGVGSSLGADLASVLRMVGVTISRGDTILGHANSIDCSRLLQTAGRTQSCGR